MPPLDGLKRRVRSLSTSIKRSSVGHNHLKHHHFVADFVLVFPLAVTRLIFLLCCGAEYEHRVDEFTPNLTPSPHYTIAQVSHAWRVIINTECPFLWNRIHISISPFIKQGIRNHLSHLLSRSDGLPLKLTVRAVEAPKSRTVENAEGVMQSFLHTREDICKMILGTCPRWHTVCIDPGLFGPGDLAVLRGRIPQLENLVIDCHLDAGRDVHRVALDLTAFADAPSLCSAELRSVLAYKLPSNLRSLVYAGQGDGKIKSSEYFYLHALISGSVHLVYLELSHIYIPPALTKHCIRNLGIEWIYIRDSNLWGMLQLPSVQRVDIACADLDKLPIFVSASQCCVVTLHLIWASSTKTPPPLFFTIPVTISHALLRLHSLTVTVDRQITPRLDAFTLEILEVLKRPDMLAQLRMVNINLSPAYPNWQPNIPILGEMHSVAIDKQLKHLSLHVTDSNNGLCVAQSLSNSLPPIAIGYILALRRLRGDVKVEFVVNGHDLLE